MKCELILRYYRSNAWDNRLVGQWFYKYKVPKLHQKPQYATKDVEVTGNIILLKVII